MATPGTDRVSVSSMDDTTDAEGEPPELTDRFLLKLFKSCNITQDHVNTLGIHLDVEEYDIAEAKHSHPTNPAMQAVMVCDKWRQMHPEESEDRSTAYRKLKSVMRAINLTRGHRKMIRHEHGVEHVSHEALSRTAVWDRVKDMTQHQAHRFGLNLALNEDEIDNIVRTVDSGGPQAMRMFTDWRRCSDLSGEVAVDFLNNAIDSAYQNTTSRQGTRERERLLANGSRRGYQPIREPQANNNNFTTFFQSNKKPIAFLIVIWIILGMAVAAAMAMGVFSFEDRHVNIPILPGDIVKIPLPFRLPPYVSILLRGVEDDCTGHVIVQKDSEIEYSHEYMIPDCSLNYTYLLPGSSVMIYPRDLINMSKGASYGVCIIDNAKKAFRRQMQPGSSKCHMEESVQCCPLHNGSNVSAIFLISKPSYYFVRCEKIPEVADVNCTHLRHRYYNITRYRYPNPLPQASVNLVAQLEQLAVLQVHSNYFPNVVHNMTLLAKLDNNCGDHHDKYFLEIRYLTVFREYDVYLSMAIGVYFLFIFIITIYVYKRCMHHN